METSTLKKFAPAARNQLVAAIGLKLDYVLSARTPDYLTTYARQVAALRELAQTDRVGLIERVAYTWFNRLAALRFMDARGWHPFGARVLTPAMGDTQPELLKVVRADAMPEELRRHTNPARLADLLDGRVPSPDAQGEVYRQLVLAACRYYHALLPDIFERINGETELLLPDDLLTENSIVHGFRTGIRDEDCGDAQRANVEVLGWLYQFYISERKDQVMARKSAVPTEDIPAVTQLFTPHWIVRYLVENSLGRLWLLNRPASRLREHMPYYIEGEPETEFLRISGPEEIRLVDPAAGSGHMLTYAFDLLALFYEEEGHAPSEIPRLILRNNLCGLDICPRAAQLAELALVFKARERSRRFFQPEHFVRPNIIELREVRFGEEELAEYIRAVGLGSLFNDALRRLLRQFEDAKNFGSLIQPCMDEENIRFVQSTIAARDLGGHLFLRDTHLRVLRVLDQAEALTQRYHVVVANPPYMGSGALTESLKALAKSAFPRSKSDTFAMFMERVSALCVGHGFASLVTMHSWMFLTSFEELRRHIIDSMKFVSLAHIGPRGFDSIGGEVVQTVAFVVQRTAPGDSTSTFVRLVDGKSELEKADMLRQAIATEGHDTAYRVAVHEFLAIPGCPIAYWLSPKLRACFGKDTFFAHMNSEGAVKTGNNARFIRYFWEVDASDVGSTSHWRKHPKGGGFRRWYGNLDCVVDWSPAARLHYRQDVIARIPIEESWDIEGITWSAVSGGDLSFRYKSEEEIANNAALFIYPKEPSTLIPYLCCLNSVLAKEFLRVISPTVNCLVGDVLAVPFPRDPRCFDSVQVLGERLVVLARTDWNNFESSCDFFDHPLLRPGIKAVTLSASWHKWQSFCIAAIRSMQELETENNRLFIAAYGLEGELQPEVPEDQITLARADVRRDVAAFLSYAVGCMMGRYSLDHPGLILADAGDTLREYLAKVGRATEELTFAPDEDGIIPVLDGEWFADDVVSRTRDFLRNTFGEATLRENLRFIEESLGKDLRKYFLTDFYKEHLQTYKKRPIYWMVQSPKRGFAVLVYLHRYTRDSLNLVLNRYLREYQAKVATRIASLAQAQVSATSAAAKTEARKESDKLTRVLLECQEWERDALLPLAQQRIELDLDDGVKVNYLKLAEVLAPIPGLAAAEE
jgi:hypothetical protein